MVQRAGFEPAKHYALGPHPSPFDRSGTSALQSSKSLTYITMVNQIQGGKTLKEIFQLKT